MGVYIKGMEMPKGCWDCAIYWDCEERKKKKENERDCPLVSIPPHGRLIDADDFIIQLSDGSVSDAIRSGISYRMSKMPTIIEAEEGE